jgi:AcrR family transcriptional regulator
MTATSSPALRGRPRSTEVHHAILRAALDELADYGFRALSTDAIAERAGVGKMTLYRRWPNKAAIVMDAFLTLVGPETKFPERPRAIESIKLQMRSQAKFFRSKLGRTIKALLGEAQFDPELAEAFRERWIVPRRRGTETMIRQAIRQGDLRPNLDLEATIDMLYGPLYYRLQIGTGPFDDAFTDTIFRQVMSGLETRPRK